MAYYDSTVASYDNQIRSNNQKISDCNTRIRQLEDDIEDLGRIKIKVGNVDTAVDTAASSTSRKINNLPSLITNPFSFLKLNYFSNFLDVIKGNDHTRAKKGVENAVYKINSKINELKREIENLRGQITQCNNNINSLSRQRSNYIAVATAPKPEPAPQPQPEPKKVESKTTTSSKTSSKSSKSSSKKKK